MNFLNIVAHISKQINSSYEDDLLFHQNKKSCKVKNSEGESREEIPNFSILISI